MDATPAAHTSRFYLIRIAALFVLLIAAFAVIARYNASQRANLQQTTDNLAVLSVAQQNHDETIALHEKRIATLEEKFTKMAAASKSVAEPGPAAAFPADAQERIAKLEKELANLKAGPVSTSQDSEKTFRAIHLLSSYHHLADKVMSGKPFASELDALEELADKDDVIEKQLTILAPFASNGVPTYAQLLVSFDESLDQLTIYEATPPAGASLWERFVYNIRHLVNIRRTNEQQSGNSVEAIVARASAHLDRQETEAAIAEIKTLPDAARSNFTSWIEEAQMAAIAPGVIDNLEEPIMQKAFQPPAPETPKS